MGTDRPTVEHGTRTNSDGVEIVTKPSSFKERMFRAAEQVKAGEEINVSDTPSTNGTHKDSVAEVHAKDNEVGESALNTNVKEITAPAAQEQKKEKSGYRRLEEGLEIANRQLEDYKTRAEKYKDYDEVKARAEAAEKKLQEIEPKFVESENWRAQHGILRSDEFQTLIAQPRQQIASIIKQELKTDGVPEDIWERAQNVATRYELEKLVDSNIKSTLLKGQFYDLYFKDLELRKAEHAALAAPVQWIENQKLEEQNKRESFRAEQNRTLDTVWQKGSEQARDMNMKLGENRIIELTYIQGNKEHNEKVVKPILETAHRNARAELQDMILSGRPVDTQVAAGVIYKWEQAIAGQAAHQDRLRWFNKYKESEKELASLREKHDRLLNRASPVPDSNGSNMNGVGKVTGDTMAERIHSLAQSQRNER